MAPWGFLREVHMQRTTGARASSSQSMRKRLLNISSFENPTACPERGTHMRICMCIPRRIRRNMFCKCDAIYPGRHYDKFTIKQRPKNLTKTIYIQRERQGEACVYAISSQKPIINFLIPIALHIFQSLFFKVHLCVLILLNSFGETVYH